MNVYKALSVYMGLKSLVSWDYAYSEIESTAVSWSQAVGRVNELFL